MLSVLSLGSLYFGSTPKKYSEMYLLNDTEHI